MNVANGGENPKYIKVGKQLNYEEMEGIKKLVKEFRDVFAQWYEELGNKLPIEVANHSIIMIPEAKREIKTRPKNPRIGLLPRRNQRC